ncbi:MAG: hypothetical protein ACSLE6_13495 [Mycobacterium sp.]
MRDLDHDHDGAAPASPTIKQSLCRHGVGCGARATSTDAATEEKADLLDDFVSIVYGFAARRYGLRSARRRTDAVIAALDIDPKLAAGLG